MNESLPEMIAYLILDHWDEQAKIDLFESGVCVPSLNQVQVAVDAALSLRRIHSPQLGEPVLDDVGVSVLDAVSRLKAQEESLLHAVLAVVKRVFQPKPVLGSVRVEFLAEGDSVFILFYLRSFGTAANVFYYESDGGVFRRVGLDLSSVTVQYASVASTTSAEIERFRHASPEKLDVGTGWNKVRRASSSFDLGKFLGRLRGYPALRGIQQMLGVGAGKRSQQDQQDFFQQGVHADRDVTHRSIQRKSHA